MPRFVPYAQRPEWADVVPVPQDDGPKPPAAIAYTDEYRSTLDTLRGLLAVGEVSQRGFNLTSAVIHLNPAHYTAWQYRRSCITKLLEGASDAAARVQLLKADVAFTSNVILSKGSKNYQLWYHRRWLVERTVEALVGGGSGSGVSFIGALPTAAQEVLEGELGVTSRILAGIGPPLVKTETASDAAAEEAEGVEDDEEGSEDEDDDDDEVEEDAKNYHAWAHRQWVVATFGAGLGAPHPASAHAPGTLRALHPVPELALTTRMLRSDVRNNSVWSHRWFVLQQLAARMLGGGSSSRRLPYWLASPEVDLAVVALARVTLNEAAWGYLRGILKVAAAATPADFAEAAGAGAEESTAAAAWPGDAAAGLAVLEAAAAEGTEAASSSRSASSSGPGEPIAARVLRLCAGIVGPAAAVGRAEAGKEAGVSPWAAELLAEWYCAVAEQLSTQGSGAATSGATPAALGAAAASLFSLAGRSDPVRAAYWSARAAAAAALGQ